MTLHASGLTQMNVNDRIVEIGAHVALLTRNIRIEGEEYDEMESESFGGRVIVSQTISDGNQLVGE